MKAELSYKKINIQDSKKPNANYLHTEVIDPSRYWKDCFAQKENKLLFFKESELANTDLPHWSCFPDGLPGALICAYISEYDVAITPDDTWITILHAFYCHVQANAEKLRSKFVDHEGKKEINISLLTPLTPEVSEEVIEAFVNEASAQTKGDVKELFQCNFSTTTKIHRIVSSVALLGVLKSYYSFVCSACGIRNIYFSGTLDDWMKLRAKVMALDQYELDWWIPGILDIIDNFIKTFKGDPNKDFWNKMMNINGSDESGEYDEITGWIKTFYPYDIHGELHKGPLHMDQIPRTTFKVPFTLKASGKDHEMLFAAGFSGTRIENETFRPIIGYSLLQVKTPEEIKQDELLEELRIEEENRKYEEEDRLEEERLKKEKEEAAQLAKELNQALSIEEKDISEPKTIEVDKKK